MSLRAAILLQLVMRFLFDSHLENILDMILDLAPEFPKPATQCVERLVLHVTCLTSPDITHAHHLGVVVGENDEWMDETRSDKRRAKNLRYLRIFLHPPFRLAVNSDLLPLFSNDLPEQSAPSLFPTSQANLT